jgi:hypothetical protein
VMAEEFDRVGRDVKETYAIKLHVRTVTGLMCLQAEYPELGQDKLFKRVAYENLMRLMVLRHCKVHGYNGRQLAVLQQQADGFTAMPKRWASVVTETREELQAQTRGRYREGGYSGDRYATGWSRQGQGPPQWAPGRGNRGMGGYRGWPRGRGGFQTGNQARTTNAQTTMAVPGGGAAVSGSNFPRDPAPRS